MPETKGFKDGNTIYTYVDEVARNLANPAGGNTGDVLTRTETGTEWAAPSGGGGGSAPFVVGVAIPIETLYTFDAKVAIQITSGATDINALSAAIDAGAVRIEAAITEDNQTIMTFTCDQVTDMNVDVASFKTVSGVLIVSVDGEADITGKITITVGSLTNEPGVPVAVTATLSPLVTSGGDDDGMPHDLTTEIFVHKVNGDMVLGGDAKDIFDTLSDLSRYQNGYADESVFDNYKLYENTASNHAQYRRRCYRLSELLYDEAIIIDEKEIHPIMRAIFANVSTDSDGTTAPTLRVITLDFSFITSTTPYTVSVDVSYSESVLSVQPVEPSPGV